MKRSLYREYRPQTFAELVGQQHVARTLHNAVETGSVAHAYLFAGPRGTGKTSAARILAKALNCTGTEERPVTGPTATPCGVCRSCGTIAATTSLDVIEMDAASNRGIDDIRELRDRVAFAPVEGRYKVYIVDEVHMLTDPAFNALLKTLEEPPPNVVFVLATTEPHKIPETIISRCQRFDFHRPHPPEIARLLRRIVDEENTRTAAEAAGGGEEDEAGGEATSGGAAIEIQDAALLEIARHSQGGFRDAIGTLEKLIAYSEGAIAPAAVLDLLGVTDADLLFEITDIVIERQTADALQFVQRLADAGADYSQFIRDLLRHLRQLFLLQHLEEAADDLRTLRALGQTVELDEQALDRLLPQAHQLHPRETVHAIETLGQAQREIREGLDPRLQFELALVRMTRPQVDHSAAGLEERLRRLEAAVAAAGAAGFAVPGAAGGSRGATTEAPAAETSRTAPAPAPRASAVASADTPGGAAETAAPSAAETAAPSAAETAAPSAAETAAPSAAETAGAPGKEPAGAAEPAATRPAESPVPSEPAPADEGPAGDRAAPGETAAGAGETAAGADTPTTERPAAAAAGPAAEPASEHEAAAETADEAVAGEAPGAEQAKAPADAASVPTIDRVRRAWELILQRVQATSVPLYALLRDARPAALEGEMLVVTMPSAFALKKAGEPGNAEHLAGAVEEVLGWRLTPRFAPGSAGAEPDAPAAPAAAPPQEIDFTAMIRMAEETFDAEQLPDDQ